VLVGTHDKKTLVDTFDWYDFLSNYFRVLPGIKSYQHFRFSKDEPGIILCMKTLNDPPTRINILKKDVVITDKLPSLVEPEGFSLERQHYLFKEIRQFCCPGTEDEVAPQPTPSLH